MIGTVSHNALVRITDVTSRASGARVFPSVLFECVFVS